MDKEFFKKIEGASKKARESVQNAIVNQPYGVLSFTVEVKLDDEDVLNFGLNDDISIFQECTVELAKTKYLYKGIDVNPDCYYLRPEDYHPVSTLKILQECIDQGTHHPDIKYLERGEEKMSQD